MGIATASMAMGITIKVIYCYGVSIIMLICADSGICREGADGFENGDDSASESSKGCDQEKGAGYLGS